MALERAVGLGTLFRLRGAIPPPADVVVVSMDRRSGETLGQPEKLRDWERSLHASLVDRLTELGASVIVFDVFFEQPRAGDERLAASLSRSQRGVLAQRLSQEVRAGVVLQRLIYPTPALATVAAGLGPFPLPKVPNRVDQFWTFFNAHIAPSPTLPVLALQLHVLRVIGIDHFFSLLRAGDLAGGPPATLTADTLRSLLAELHRRLSREPSLVEALSTAARQRLPVREGRLFDALLRACASGQDSFINYYGPPTSIRTVPYSRLFDADPAALDLTGKVVFVGGLEMTAEQIDGFYTVFSGADGVDISGVEIAATAFANLLTSATLRYPDRAVKGVLLLVLGLLLGAASYRWRNARQAVAAVLGVGLLYLGLVQWAFGHANVWLPVAVPALLQIPCALALAVVLRYLVARRERENAVHALRYFVPDDVAGRLAENRDPANPERVYGVCLSSDIAGYTTLAEGLDPELLAALTNQYFDLLGGQVRQHGGEMLEIVGDGMTCLWPTPRPDREARLHACLTALEIHRQVVASFNRRHPDCPFHTRLGLHAGWVAVGYIGGGGHYVYGVTGDIPNTASRIEGLNKYLGTVVLAEHAVVVGLDAQLLLRPVGRFQLQGKAEVLSVSEIVTSRVAATSDERALCAMFAAGLELFAARCWDDAARQFYRLLEHYPNDGPGRFYLQQSRQNATAEPGVDGAVIRLTQK